MTYSVYIASPFIEWPTAASLRAYLRSHLIDCTASWIDEAAACHGNEGLADIEPDVRQSTADRNDADILNSHAVVALCFAGKGTEQYEELGFARGKDIPVVYVDHGRMPHLSVYRAESRYVADWGSLIVALAELRVRRYSSTPIAARRVG